MVCEECGLEDDAIEKMGEEAHRTFHEHQKFFAPEDLDPELVDHLVVSSSGWNNIQHPLVQSIMHVPPLNKSVNESLRHKKVALEDAYAREEWSSVIFLHERPWRVDALVRIMDDIEDDTAYWELVCEVWVDTENLWQWGPAIREILEAERPNREALMDEKEREALADLPERIEIWRGYHHDESRNGWSWTLDRERALWFARRFAAIPELPRGRLAHAWVDRDAVIAHFLDRNEAEIVVDPEDLQDVTSEPADD